MKPDTAKKVLCIGSSLLMLAAVAAGMPVSAEGTGETFTEGKLTYEYLEEGGVSLVSVEKDVESLVIPSKAGGESVVSIGEAALENCAALTDLVIEDGVQKIEAGAFFYCLSLEHIEIPDSVTEIGGYAFANCYALHEIELPPHLKSISEYMFYYNIGLEEITLPPETEQVGYMSFAGCYSLRAMHLPASLIYFSDTSVVSCIGLTEIDVDPANEIYVTDDAGALTTADGSVFLLYPAGSQAESYTVPDTVEVIAGYSFSGAVKLKQINLPENITAIGAGAFSECRGLESLDYPPLTEIGAGAFADCESLAQFTIPETVTAIGQNAFYGCSALTEIVIPESVETVMAWAFAGCTGIQKITVPDTVTTIEECAFGYVPGEATDAAGGAMSLQEGFVLAGSAESQAKIYAEESGITFEQVGLSKKALGIIIVCASIVLVILVIILVMLRRKEKAAKVPAETAAPVIEEEPDPNYSSILADENDEDTDPYDRSYGITPEDADASAEADDAETESDADR